ncbi:hypothetical protein [Kitasatospora sp. NPDC048538]|uniref:cupin domain-containing protein n=1 Tax=unclassified Kitasatospora TaxID=2633591 RepID=UPI0034055A9B
MTGAGTEPPAAGGAPVPKLLCDTRALAALDPAPAGALWRLAEPGRQLDANLVHVPPGGRIDTHTEPDLDVLVLVVAGDATLHVGPERQPLTEGGLFWLPHGSTRSLTAGDRGVSYLTVHRRRPGLQIRHQDR